MFDNSSNHLKKAEDCRNDKAIYLNLSDGGKNTPMLRDGFFAISQGEKSSTMCKRYEKLLFKNDYTMAFN
jgi:hypothetical protein